MSDENKVGLQTDPNDISNIEKLIKTIDKLDGSLQHLAQAGRGMNDLKQMMTTMQATMVTGFTEMSKAAQKSDDAILTSRKKTNDQLVAEEERAWEKLHFTSQAARSRIEAAQDAANARRLASAAAAANKELEQGIAAENRRAAALQSAMERQDLWLADARGRRVAAEMAAQDKMLALEIGAENRRASALQASMEKQDLWMAEERGRQYAAATLQAAKLEALAMSSAEKQRVLNTNFATSPLSSQISTAERSAVYSNLGGNAAERFGSAAATADLAALRAQYAAMPSATRAAADGINLHNDAMREGHALARGLSGSLGALWLTYGSLVPLAAGAAIGASLKNIVEAGKEVEYQLKFVEALGNAPVKINDFLRVTDGTVVSIKEAAEGMRALSQNGLNAIQSLQILPTILNLAVIGEMSVGAAALSATGVLSAFNLQLADAGRVGDVFAQAAASSNTSVALMTESMKQASTVASLYHVSLEETAAGLGQLAKINITGSAAGTAFTNMLTGLYSPTNQAQKALAQLKVTTDDGQGGLKNSTVLLGELRQALSQYNEQAQTVFLNDIFTTRGTKAASTLLSNLDEYKIRIDEAVNSTGFMSAAVAKLEDTTEGAFRQMKNSIGDSLNKAFESSSPMLQNLITELAEVARSKETAETLTGLADAALRLTNVLVDHAKAIALVAAGYLALRVGASLAAASTAAATATTTAGFLATSAAAVTLSNSLKLIVASLGWISLAITAAVTIYQLFIATTSDVEKADQRLRNSIDTNIEFINRETKALEERNKAWNPVTQQFDRKPEEQAGVTPLQQRVDNAQKTLDTMSGPTSTNVADWYEKRRKAVQDLKAAQEELHVAEMSNGVLQEGLQEERDRKAKAGVLAQIDALVLKGQTETTINGRVVQMDAQGNEKSRAIAQEAAVIAGQLRGNIIGTKEAQLQLTAATQDYNGALMASPAKVDKKAAADELRQEMERLKLSKEVLAVEQQTEAMRLQAANKAGSLGDLGLLDAQRKAAKDRADALIAEAKAGIDLVDGIANKRAAEQKYQNQLEVGRVQRTQADTQYDIAKADTFRRMADEETKFKAKTLEDQGRMVEAYLLEYEANNGRSISRVKADLLATTDETDAEVLRKWLKLQEDMKAAGVTEATGKSLMADFNKDLTELQAKLSNLSNLSGADAGLGAIFTNAYAAMDEYASRIGDIASKQKELQDLATANPGDAKLQQNATAELSKMTALAEQMRSMWVSVAGTIGDSLTTAFGRGGTALGGLLQATVAYAAQKSRIEEEKDKAGDDPVKQLQAQQVAAKALESAQLSAYAKMAGAAKGYFKENTVGYQVASTAEKAFTVLQLAEAARMFVVKSGYLMGLLGIQVASQAEAAAAEGAYTLSSIAMAGARAAASGIAAAVSAMVGWPFPLNIIALGATIAAVGALGVKIAGGGGSSAISAQQRQESNGTGVNPDGTLNGGGVLGDSKAKSESIARSLEAIEKTSGLGLAHTISMDNSLKQLVAGISGLASLLVQGTNLTSPVAKDTQGAQQGIFDKVLGNQSIGEKLSGGLLNKIVGGIFGGATSVEDVGLKLNSGTVAALMQSGGVNVNQYTDTKKSGGLFHSDKYSTKYESLGPEINDQFSKIFASLYDTVVAGADMLGLGGSEFEKKLQGFVINIGEISTKGMTGEEIEKALQTAFSKLGDDMAKFGVDGLQQFQKVGEGYLETLTRVANDFLQVNDVLSVLGKSFNVTGLAAITLSESLIEAAGGLETLTENTKYFVENFLTEAEKMAPIIKSVDNAFAQLGLKVPTTIEDYKNLVLSQDLNTLAGQQMYAALIAIAPQFKTIADYAAEMSGVLVRSAQEIRDERKNLQDQLDNLTMTPEQLDAKDRAQIDPSNLNLYDQVKAAQAAKDLLSQIAADAKDRLSLLAQIYAVTGNAAGAAAVLEEQHREALVGLSDSTAALTRELWAAQAAAQAAQNITTKQDALISAYTSQQNALQAIIDTSRKFAQSMLDLKKSLQLGDLSTLSPEQKLLQTKARYEDLLTRAKGGDKDAQSQVGQAAQDFLTADRAYNASNSTYASDAMKVQKDLTDLANSAGSQADTAEQQLEALNKQVLALVTIKDSLTLGFEKVQQAILDLAAAMATAGTPLSPAGNSSTVTSLYHSILGREPEKEGLDFWTNALDTGTPLQDVVKGFTNSDEKLRNDVTGLYKNILGRAPEKEGLDFWTNALKNGTSMADVKQGFYNSDEYLSSHGGGHAYGGVMGEGYAVVGEHGREVVQVGTTSRVYNASQSAGMFAPNTAANDDNSRRLAVLEEEAKADKRQRAIIAQAAAEDARKQRELTTKLIATQRSNNTTRRSK